MDIRTRYLIVTLLSWILFAWIAYVQLDVNVVPSPLSVLSTMCLAVVSILLLFVTWFCPRKTGQFIYGFLLILFSLLGLISAVRQAWLNHYLPAAKFCFESKETIWSTMSNMPVMQLMQNIWYYGTNCPSNHIELLGFSLVPVFIFIYLIMLILVAWQLSHVSRFGAHGHVGQRLGS